MAYIFFLVGILAVLFGGYITATALNAASSLSGNNYTGLAVILGIAPGIGTISGGLIFIGLGEVLVRLANIDRQTDRTAAASERTADYVERQQ